MGKTKTRQRRSAPAGRAGLELPVGSPASDSYLDLVRQYPLRPIRDDADLAVASAVIDRLSEYDLDAGQQDYLDVLTDLVEAYEDEHVVIPDAPGPDVLRMLMETNGIGQSELHRKTGIAQSTISAVLSGQRSLTVQQMVTFGKLFRVTPDAFMGTGNGRNKDTKVAER
jgi:HTH-type transcriptional regulator / antitoxin HigA